MSSLFQSTKQNQWGFIIYKLIMRTEEKNAIREDSPEWNTTQYQLQMITGHPSIKLLTLHRYPFPVQKASNDSCIRAIVDTTDLKYTFKSSVIEKKIPLEDVIFICGHWNLDRHHRDLNKPFSFLICELALGNIAPFQEDSPLADSLLIEAEPDNDDPYHYDVMLKSYDQYRIKYECTFLVGKQNQIANQSVICSQCGSRMASLYCKEERKYFCEYCSSVQHPTEAEWKKTHQSPPPPRHQVEPISRVNSLPLCQSHGYKFQAFCLTCQKYLCTSCCEQQLHNKNEDHPVRPLDYLYAEKRQILTRLPIKPRQRLNKYYEMAEQKREQLMENFRILKLEITAEYDKAMEDLQRLHRQRLMLVQTDIINIEMELQKIDWYFSFIKVQEEVLKPLYYFKLQAKLEQDPDLFKSTGFSSTSAIQSDLDHYTVIRVGDVKTISEFRQADFPHQRKENDRLYYQRMKEKASNEELKKRIGERIVTYDPSGDPPQKGELQFMLENTGVHFFKIKQLE